MPVATPAPKFLLLPLSVPVSVPGVGVVLGSDGFSSSDGFGGCSDGASSLGATFSPPLVEDKVGYRGVVNEITTHRAHTHSSNGRHSCSSPPPKHKAHQLPVYGSGGLRVTRLRQVLRQPSER